MSLEIRLIVVGFVDEADEDCDMGTVIEVDSSKDSGRGEEEPGHKSRSISSSTRGCRVKVGKARMVAPASA
jgi:hypothetical protein